MSYSDECKHSPRDSDDHASAGGKSSPGNYRASRFANIQDLHKNHSPCIFQRDREEWGCWNTFYSGLAVLEPIRAPMLEEDRMVPYKDVLYENGKICETCRGITLEALLSPDGYLLQTFTFMDLSAKDGCEICRLVVESLTGGRPRRDRRESEFNRTHPKEPFRMIIANIIGTPYVQDTILIFNGQYDAWLGVYTDEGNKASNWIPGRRIALRPERQAIMELIQAWMDRSIDRPEDDQNEVPILPKRLLDVSSQDGTTVRLKDFSTASGNGLSPRGVYICLSHRRGPTVPCTTSANLLSRTEGIFVDDLPPTFRDAIFITRSLGVQYIWIDSLCIIQDSHSDWEEESAKMGDYYGLSWLTIGAGITGHNGLFSPREISSDRLTYYRVVLEDPDRCILYFTKHRTTLGSCLGNEEMSVLRSRGWTFQEELLPPRYLGFQDYQMFYRCGDYINFEDGRLEWLQTPGAIMYRLGLGDGTRSEDSQLHRGDLHRKDWFSFVRNYSGRCLTETEDRLPALSGIAHIKQKFSGDQYLAGLWRNELPRQLCWHKSSWLDRQHTYPARLQAPSWSWAATEGTTSLFDYKEGLELEILHASVEAMGRDPLGAVKVGMLKVRGLVGPCFRTTLDFFETAFSLRVEDEISGGRREFRFHPDVQEFRYTIDEVYILHISERIGLALLPESPSLSRDVYTRVGLLENCTYGHSYEYLTIEDAYKDIPRRVITIV